MAKRRSHPVKKRRPPRGDGPRVQADSKLELKRAIHELEVYQEEIRIQNQQLIESQRLLEESRDRYADLYDLAPVPYVTLCPNGVIREINRIGANMLSLPRTRALESPLILFIETGSRRTFLSHMQRCRSGKAPTTTELRVVSREGRHIDVEITSGAGFEFAPDDWRYPTTIFDLTERKRAEAERRRLLAVSEDMSALQSAAASLRQAKESAEIANRVKDNFLAVVSHELRTPLTTILLWARLLRQGKLNQTTHHQAVESIEQSAQAQLKLVDDLLDVSRIVAGKMRLNQRPMRLRGVIQSAVDLIRPAARIKAIKLASVRDRGDWVVRIDADRIRQVLTNVLDNAVKFTPEGGWVRLSVRRVKDFVRITVSDNGRGINKEMLPHVFERFQSADRLSGGLGLGLSIARQLVELHGGRILAKSAGDHKGATFVIELAIHAGGMKE